MKINLRFLWAILVISILYSCSDEEMQKEPKNLFPYNSGNYWIYRIVVTSADGLIDVFPYEDSVWVEGEIAIADKNYWKLLSTLSGTRYMRDSADCVLMRELNLEQIIYSTNKDTLYSNPPAYKVIDEINKLTSVHAGQFRTINCRTILRRDPQNTNHDFEYPKFGNDFYTIEQYICSSKIGLVKNVYYYLGGTVEYELVRYKVN